MATPGTPKTMSSRLLTMKFMQRAAASTPSSSTPSTPASNDQSKSNKRRKVSHIAESPQDVDILVNQAAIKAAIEEEEKKLESALTRRAEELGDAHWVLHIPEQAMKQTMQTPLNVVQVGFAQIDSADAPGDDNDLADPSHHTVPCLRRYNMENKKKAKTAHKKNDKTDSRDSESESESDSSDSDSDSDSSEAMPGRKSFGSNPRSTPNTHPVARKILKGKKSAEQLRAMQFQEKRRKKEVNLNSPKGISSISTGGSTPSGRQSTNFTCFVCNQPGHKASDCKKSQNKQGR